MSSSAGPSVARDAIPAPDQGPRNTTGLTAQVPPPQPAASVRPSSATSDSARATLQKLCKLGPDNGDMVAKLGALSLPTDVIGSLDTMGGLMRAMKAMMTPSPVSLQQLEAEGRMYEAWPLQCRWATNLLLNRPDHPDTLKAVFALADNMFERGKIVEDVYSWLVPRAALQWGLDHPDTRKLVQQAAYVVYRSPNPREHMTFVRIVTEVAGLLPGGLGWGVAQVTPLPDVAAYNKHAALLAKANAHLGQGQLRQAKDILVKCKDFFGRLGPHWLGLPLKVGTITLLGMCLCNLGQGDEGIAMLIEGKRVAQKELGVTHKATVDITWQLAECFQMVKQPEKALSMFQKSLRLCIESVGPRHCMVITIKWAMARVLCTTGRLKESEAMVKDVFEQALKAGGPRGTTVRDAVEFHWLLLHQIMGRKEEAQALKKRAADLGCDVSGCSMNEQMKILLAMMSSAQDVRGSF